MTKKSINDIIAICDKLSDDLKSLDIRTANNLQSLDNTISQQNIEMYRELGNRRIELQTYSADNNNRINRIIEQFNVLANDYTLTKKTAAISLFLSVLSLISLIAVVVVYLFVR